MNWDQFSAHIQEGFTPEDMQKIRKAFIEMERAHDGELRDDGKPYRLHPIESAISAYNMGERDPEVLAAILTHDVLESTKDHKRPVTAHHLGKRHGWALSYRVSLMTKEGHDDTSRADAWKRLWGAKDHRTFKAKSYERLNNVTSFDKMKAKKGETKRARINRKVKETVKEFLPIITWLLTDVEVRNFKTEAARDRERILINYIYQAFRLELAKYGATFEIKCIK